MLIGYLRDVNPAAMSAGVASFMLYVFLGLPVQLAVLQDLGLTDSEATSWAVITWLTTGAVSLGVTLYLRQPLSITMSIPSIVYLGTLGTQYSFPELAGANLMAAALILVLGVLGVGARMLRWFPLPLVMAMFAGTIIGFVIRLVDASVSDAGLILPIVGAFLLGHAIGNPRLPPVGLAVATGVLMLTLTQQWGAPDATATLPQLAVPTFKFTVAAFIEVAIPLVLLTVAIGNTQGIGYLQAQGYQVRANFVTIVSGLNSLVNAVFGGSPAGVGRSGIAVMASPEAGPRHARYWACVVPSVLSIGVAFLVGPVIAVVESLPGTFIAAIAGLAILSALQGALAQAFRGNLQFGATIAFAVAMTPFSYLGLGAPFWAIVAGLAASFAAERRTLLEYWFGYHDAG